MIIRCEIWFFCNFRRNISDSWNFHTKFWFFFSKKYFRSFYKLNSRCFYCNQSWLENENSFLELEIYFEGNYEDEVQHYYLKVKNASDIFCLHRNFSYLKISLKRTGNELSKNFQRQPKIITVTDQLIIEKNTIILKLFFRWSTY